MLNDARKRPGLWVVLCVIGSIVWVASGIWWLAVLAAVYMMVVSRQRG